MHNEFGIVAHNMPIAMVDPVEKMIHKDVRYRPTALFFSAVSTSNNCNNSNNNIIIIIYVIIFALLFMLFLFLSALLPSPLS